MRRRFVILQGGRCATQAETVTPSFGKQVLLSLAAILRGNSRTAMLGKPQLQVITSANSENHCAHSIPQCAIDCCGL